MKDTPAPLANARQIGARSSLRVAAPTSQSNSPARGLDSVDRRRPGYRGHGIEVHEDELGSVSAQQLYKLRCECGRSWFDLELPKLVQCPGCLRLNVVTI